MTTGRTCRTRGLRKLTDLGEVGPRLASLHVGLHFGEAVLLDDPEGDTEHDDGQQAGGHHAEGLQEPKQGRTVGRLVRIE